MRWIMATLLALALATEASGQGLLEGMDKKLDTILQKLDAVPPVVVPPPAACPVKNSGGLFSVGDKVRVLASTGGMQIRTAPDLNLPFTPPFQPPLSEGTVTCAQSVGGLQWVRVDFATGVDGWARATGFERLGVVVPPPPPPPPPPIEPVPGANYYISVAGDDANPGTVDKPFKTLAKAIPLIEPGQVLIVRGGTYDTKGFVVAGGQTIFNSGVSWDLPIRVHAAPGETPEFVRELPTGSPFTVDQVRAGVHAPTQAQCEYYATQVPGSFLPYPEKCWAGGSDPHWLWLFQDDTQSTTGPLLDFTSNTRQVKFIEFRGISWNGRGIAKSIVSTSTLANCEPTAQNIRFFNADIGYSAASAFTQPGTCDNDSKGVRNQSNIQLFDSKIHHCGIPFDPARKNPWAKYLHCFYMHIGGNECIRCEIYEAAGGGFEPDGHNNKLVDSYVHDNSCLGGQVGGGDNHVVTGNVFGNNGCAELQLLSGSGHTFAHNTMVAGPANKSLGLQATFRGSLVANNIVTGYATSIYSIQPYDTANVYQNNLIDGQHLVGSGMVQPVEIGTIHASPLLDAQFRPLPGSPALKAATDGKNIGAK